LFTARQNEQQQLIEERRAQAERELEDQRAQDAALQAYLDQMNTLYLEEDLSDAKVRTLLRARTLTVLGRLDPSRKTQVTQFLSEAELVTSVDGREPILALDGASLSNADLNFLDLRGAHLSDAHLSDADLIFAALSDADLRNADLRNADLRGANLSDANLSDAYLGGANLEGVYVTDEQLDQAISLEGATMPDGSKHH
jgi:uncharacterized protein YjbI with pentapeptide repeats